MSVITYTLELPYPPRSGNHTTRTGQGRHYTVKEVVAYRQRLAIASSGLGVARLRLPGPLAVTYWLWPPDRRARDDDNVLKVLKDAMTRAGIWVDDSNQVIRRSTVIWEEPTPGGRVLVQLTPSETLDYPSKTVELERLG